MIETQCHVKPLPTWRQVAQRYLVLVTLLNLVWEVLQLPLYTLWSTGSRLAMAFAVGHCTLGDLVIAAVSLALSVVWVGAGGWPNRRYRAVAASTVVLGVCYTIFSEWHNTTVLQSWAYAAAMPRLFGIGASPVAQWIVIPSLAFCWVRRPPLFTANLSS